MFYNESNEFSMTYVTTVFKTRMTTLIKLSQNALSSVEKVVNMKVSYFVILYQIIVN